MPRAKKTKPAPIDTVEIHHANQDVVFEVWENGADAGTRGTHMRRKRGIVFDAVLKYCEDAICGNSSISKQKVTRLINGADSLATFGRIVTNIAKIQKIKIGKTLAENIAQSIRDHYRAIENALNEQSNRQ